MWMQGSHVVAQKKENEISSFSILLYNIIFLRKEEEKGTFTLQRTQTHIFKDITCECNKPEKRLLSVLETPLQWQDWQRGSPYSAGFSWPHASPSRSALSRRLSCRTMRKRSSRQPHESSHARNIPKHTKKHIHGSGEKCDTGKLGGVVWWVHSFMENNGNHKYKMGYIIMFICYHLNGALLEHLCSLQTATWRAHVFFKAGSFK